jgi:mycothiol synthase
MLYAIVRDFRSDDYAGAERVYRAACPGQDFTAERLRFSDEQREPGRRYRRWIAQADASIVGVALYDQPAAANHPRRFALNLAVLPEYAGQGIGTALYEQLSRALAPIDPISLLVPDVPADGLRARAFWQRRGFQEALRSYGSRLDLAEVDAKWLLENDRRPQVEVKTLRELTSDPQCARKLFELLSETEADVPLPTPRAPLDFTHFRAHMLCAPQLNPDSFFIAISPLDGEYLGLSILWRSVDGHTLRSGMTGTRRAQRRRGIALSLKLRGIRWALTQGYRQIRTSNESTNRPILSLNDRLGFVRDRISIDFVKKLKDVMV